MKEAMDRYGITISFFVRCNKPFIEPILQGAPSVQIPTHWFRDRPQDSK
jgi:hypothetical protein